MRILLTNDDGYRAESIKGLFKVLTARGYDVVMIAPELNSSGAAQSISVYAPISITQVAKKMYFVSGTPADSIRLGLQVVYAKLKSYPDLVISGVNMGENIGEDVLYSGTLGAAREGTLHGIPSLAFSTPGPQYKNMSAAARIVVDLVTRLDNNRQILATPFIWNVNIPNKPYNLITGYEATELGTRKMHEPLEKQITPRGHTIYWQGVSGGPQRGAPLGTDIDVFLKQEKVSITPLEVLPTDYNQLPIITALTI